MTGFVVILAALQLAVPVRCYGTPAAWEAHKAEALAPTIAAAFYVPEQSQTAAVAGGSYIALGPRACAAVRSASAWGAFVIGHELAHRRQDVTGRSFDESEADRLGERDQAWWQRRLRAFFRLPPDPPVVRLAAGP